MQASAKELTPQSPPATSAQPLRSTGPSNHLDGHVSPGSGKPSQVTPEQLLGQLMNALRDGRNPKLSQTLTELLDSLDEPRYMTAMGTVAHGSPSARRGDSPVADPRNVMNWSEYSDPVLYLRWKLGQINAGYFPAILEQRNHLPGPAFLPVKSIDTPASACLSALMQGVGSAGGEQRDRWLKLPPPNGTAIGQPSRTYRY